MRKWFLRVRGWVFGFVHQSWLVVGLCVGVVTGVIFGMVMRVNYFGSPIWIGVCLVLLAVGYLKPRMILVLAMVMVGMLLAFFRITGELSGEEYIRGLYGCNVMVSGTVEGDPETDEGITKFKLVDLRFGEEGVESAGTLYVSMGKNEGLSREDRVILAGKLENGFGTYAGTLYRPEVIKWERAEPGSWVLRVRNWFAERINNLIPESEAKLGLSYLLGMKTGISDELSENLRIVGLTHIVVASGTHLAILVEVARKIFGKMSRMIGVLFSVVFVLVFMAMVGWTPSIMRAGMMTILTLAAWYFGRKFAPWRIILIVMAVTLMVNPNYMINMGWQLSFASYAGIMVIGPKLVKFFYGEKKPGMIGSTVLMTVAATFMTLPIILYQYGMVSLISVVANLLILPTLPYVMGLVFLTGAVAGVPLVEVAVSWVATRMLAFHIMVVEWFGGMREFLVEIPRYQMWVWGIYGLLVVLLGVGLIRRKWANRLFQRKVIELGEEQ